MNEEITNEIGGNAAETPTADSDVNTREEENAKNDSDFNEIQKNKVNDIVRDRLAQDRIARLKKYGYTTEDELDSIVEKGKKYDELKMLNDDLLKDRENLYFLKARIKDEKIDDVKTHFKGKGLEFTLDNLMELVKTHPEWLKEEVKGNTIRTFGFNTEKGAAIKPVNPEKAFKEKLYQQNGFNIE